MRIKHILVFTVTVMISVGVLVFVFTAEEVEKAIGSTEQAPIPVSVVEVTPKKMRPIITAMGEVLPELETIVQTETGGKVLYLSPELKAGQQIEKDEVLVRLEDSQSAAQISQAELVLLQANINLLHEELLGRPVYIETAQKEVEVAQQGLILAQKEMEKRTIRAPFSGLIVERFISNGDQLYPGDQVARMYGTRTSIVPIAISSSNLELLPTQLSDTSIRLFDTDTGTSWTPSGITDGQRVDRTTRLRQLWIEINQPLDANPPLVYGTFVSVQLEGDYIDDVYEIPASALSSSGTIWWIKEDILHSAQVDPIQRTDTTIFIRRRMDLPSPLVLAISPDASFTDGMRVSMNEAGVN